MAWQASPRTTSSRLTATTAGKRARLEALTRDHYTCQLAIPGTCTVVATQADHVIPLAAGGTSSVDNLQAVCEACHQVKTAQDAARGRPATRRPPTAHPGLLT